MKNFNIIVITLVVSLFFVGYVNAQSDEAEKARMRVNEATRKLKRAKEAVTQGRVDEVKQLAEDYQKNISEAVNMIEKARTQGRDVSRALEAVRTHTRTHTRVLQGLLNKVPQEAKSAIRRSIRTSQRGRNQALETLEKIKSEEIPGGKPKNIGTSEGIGSSKDIGGPPEDVGPSTGKGDSNEESEGESESERGRRGRPSGVGPSSGGPGR